MHLCSIMDNIWTKEGHCLHFLCVILSHKWITYTMCMEQCNANSYNTQIWMTTKEDPDLVSIILGCQQTCFYFGKAIGSLHGSVCVFSVKFQKDGTWDHFCVCSHSLGIKDLITCCSMSYTQCKY